MARTLTPDARRAGIAVVALVCATLLAGSAGQILAIVVGLIGGVVLCRTMAAPDTDMRRFPVSRTAGILSLLTLILVLALTPVLAVLTGNGGVALFDVF
ncbi:chromate transporter, partial [Rhizobium johnstonii]